MTLRNMLIGIDGNEANQSKRVGVGEYGFQLLKHLKAQAGKLKAQSEKLMFRIYLKEAARRDLSKETDWWQYQVVGPKFLWTQIGLPFTLFHLKPLTDVFFTPTHYAPRFCPCPRVISIMDLSYLYFPEMFKRADLWKLKNWTAGSIKKAKRVITISNSTKDDIIKYYQIEPEKVVVTYLGHKNEKLKALNAPKDMEKTEQIKKKYEIGGDYILYVGTLQPRKNLGRLIEAFKEVKAGEKKLNTKDLKLVITGKKGWLYETIFEKVKKLALTKEVIFTGFVRDEDLPALYQGTRCLVLVSLYEGFGLPALEALSLGAPVVVSRVSSLPEVVGKAGVLVNPYDVQDIARGILAVLQFDRLKLRRIKEEGLKQAKKFSWEKCARETLKVLIEAAKDNKLT